MDQRKQIKDLNRNDIFWFENERYFFDRLVGNDSAYATHIESDQQTPLSRHSEVTVVTAD